MDLMSQLCGSDILAYDYCGYGFSTGSPSEENCYESIEARCVEEKDGGISFLMTEKHLASEMGLYTHTYIYDHIYI